jgi:hypothetical protein
MPHPSRYAAYDSTNLVVTDDALEQVTMTIAQEPARGPTIAHAATKPLMHIAVNQGVLARDPSAPMSPHRNGARASKFPWRASRRRAALGDCRHDCDPRGFAWSRSDRDWLIHRRAMTATLMAVN